MEVRSFRDLRVWQRAMDLVEMVYKLSVDFPKYETYGLTSPDTACSDFSSIQHR